MTIGVPAFFHALAPNRERAKPGFVRPVLRFAVPAGVIAALSTLGSYFFARAYYYGDLEAETSAATLTLFLVALWVLAVIARPYTWWRIGLVLVMAAGFVIVLAVPWLQDFFQLGLVGVVAPWVAVGLAVAGAVVLELVWVIVQRRVPVAAAVRPSVDQVPLWS